MKGLAKTFDARVGGPGEVQAETMASILTAAADVALALDEAGVVRDVVLGLGDQPLSESREWLGQAWVETVTAECRELAEAMLREVAASGSSSRQVLNHLAAGGGELPVEYTVVRLRRGDGRAMAIGRDLRTVAALQQRLGESQQALQRDYVRMRQFETRYRLLLQTAPEPVLMVDAASHKVVEVNHASEVFFGQPAKKLIGRSFPFDCDRRTEGLIQGRLAALSARGEVEPSEVHLGAGQDPVLLTLATVGDDGAPLVMVRLLAGSGAVPAIPGRGGAGVTLLRLLEGVPDGVVLTDRDGRVLAANRAFVTLVEAPSEAQVRGRSLGDWIGRPGADLGVLMAALREAGTVRLFGTSVNGDLGSASEIEISGLVIQEGGVTGAGFVVRDVGRRLALGPHGARDLTRAVEQLTALVGRVSLRNLVRDTTDLVERHFIEAALESTRNNRTSAAEMLGLSRQSLYVKLRRYGLGSADEAGAGPENARQGKARASRKG